MGCRNVWNESQRRNGRRKLPEESPYIDSGACLDNIACGHMGVPVSSVDLWRAMDCSPMPASLYRLQIGEISSRRMRKPADHTAFRDIVVDCDDDHRHIVKYVPWMEYLLSAARLPHTRLRFFLSRSAAFHCDALDKDSSPSMMILRSVHVSIGSGLRIPATIRIPIAMWGNKTKKTSCGTSFPDGPQDVFL
ncbi:hypothetical protein BLEM_0664 [Bifidobacterium lemurum]|uniref:Uncharacterized protein n=1 Tax=Bifidobacterium lemurum TaxID=1603886 RepID=A0A261FU90_9BIFI|nr:hypothetical protein BLEM_0664 [Bifidobacterium lemurum]